jgi:hypothetical protein
MPKKRAIARKPLRLKLTSRKCRCSFARTAARTCKFRNVHTKKEKVVMRVNYCSRRGVGQYQFQRRVKGKITDRDAPEMWEKLVYRSKPGNAAAYVTVICWGGVSASVWQSSKMRRSRAVVCESECVCREEKERGRREERERE